MSKIVISAEKCKGCLLCTEACPRELIEQGSQVNAKGYLPAVFKDAEDPEEPNCTGCTFCALVCPDIAITVFR
jgi:2-oxoglutarate ferredoxin oxidoreductase subunit delta